MKLFTRCYLYLVDEEGGTFLFPSITDARAALDHERRAGLRPGLFRIPVDRSTAETFARAVKDRVADEHPILESAIRGTLGPWDPIDLSTYEGR